MKVKTKVLVVGGGPSGTVTASVLAKNGIEVLLTEKKFSFMKPCGGGISPVAFEEFDIPNELIKKQIKKIIMVSPGNNTVEVDLGPKNLFIVERVKFNEFLRERAKAFGAEVFEGSFVSSEKRKNFYLSKIAKGNEEIEIQSEYIIAADGVNSKVRLSQGIKLQSVIYTFSEVIEGISTEKCEFWFSAEHAPNFYSWVFPAAEGIHIGTGSTEIKKIRPLLETFKQRRGLIGYNGIKRIYRIPVWEGDLYNKRNIIFTGDSAGQVMPLSYEGIYYAMKSGKLAAEAVIEGRAGMYKKTWESTLGKKFMLMKKLSSYFLKNDINAEKLVSIHRRSDVQEVAKTLWLLKDSKSKSISKYIRLLGKILI